MLSLQASLPLLLSAGNPHDFRDWLGGVKRLQAEQDAAAGRRPSWAGPCHHDVALIQHTIRHSDLRLHTYRPRCLDDEEAPGGPWGLPISERVASLERQMGSRAGGKQCGSLVRMNPLAVLEPEDLQQVGGWLGGWVGWWGDGGGSRHGSRA